MQKNGRFNPGNKVQDQKKTGLIRGIVSEAERFNIIVERGENLETWKTYAYIKEYQIEIW